MDLRQFLTKVFSCYKTNNDTSYLGEVYFDSLYDGKEYNFEEAFRDLFKSYNYRTLPPCPTISEILKKHRIETVASNRLNIQNIEGQKNGRIYQFGYNADEKTYEQAKQDLIERGFTILTTATGNRKMV